jgi:hypothetical protein
MPALAPETPVQLKLLGDHLVHIQVLRHMEIMSRGILERRGAMCGKPDGRMGLLIGFRHGQGLIELPVLTRIGDTLLRPRLEDDL